MPPLRSPMLTADELNAQLVHQAASVARNMEPIHEVVPDQQGLFFARGQPVGHEPGVVGPIAPRQGCVVDPEV